ncbi:enoyl-CoA hydratase-related protein, putative [Babesia caballi]|uniref:3-hydroxyisobutyryl-CoA hydrolase n=1 Tax=Babesia caballi TaxID=5871 RepID=A0AAV4LZ54_BABCB|nr:enoyl-CoA hydratase-related protein, putative [Babesia caballi]
MYRLTRSCGSAWNASSSAAGSRSRSLSYRTEIPSKESVIRDFNEYSLLNQPFNARYFEWTHGDYLGSPMDIHTRTRAESPLISRNNVGMGFLVLNSMYTGISQVTALYRRLADLETNVYKRFVVLTSMSRNCFSHGIHPVEVQLFKEALQRLCRHENGAVLYQTVLRALDDYISNVCDLSYLIQSYKKPLVVYANGMTGGFGACLVSLANFSACHKHSHLNYNNLELGTPLLGGQSYVMAMLRGSLGEYLALTGATLTGNDLVWAGIVKRFISPDAIEVIQLTAERLTEMPEKETEFQLQEHFLPLDAKYSLERLEWLIHEHFNRPSVAGIVRSLERGVPAKKLRSHSSVGEEAARKWEMETLDALTRRTTSAPDIAEATLQLIRRVKAYKLEVLKTLEISPKRWNELQQFAHVPPASGADHASCAVLHSIQSEVLLESLQLEAASWFTWLGGVLKVPVEELWSRSRFSLHPFTPCYRSGFALSSLPALRRLHPDFDARTGSDHDAVRMKRMCERWSDDFLQRELLLMKRILA